MFSFRITLPFRIPTFAEVRSLFTPKPNTTAGIVSGIAAQVTALDNLATAKSAEATDIWQRATQLERQGDRAHDESRAAARVRDKLAGLIA